MALEIVDHQLIFDDEVDMAELKTVERFLSDELPTKIVMDFTEADVPDGRVMAKLTSIIKQILENGQYIELQAPPQLVAHNIYRIGLQSHPNLRIENMRQDEAYS